MHRSRHNTDFIDTTFGSVNLGAIMKVLVFVIFSFPIWGSLLVHIWEHVIKPLLVPKTEIAVLADRLIATHGPRAEEKAVIEEDYAWRRGEMLQQAVWKRVQQELRCR